MGAVVLKSETRKFITVVFLAFFFVLLAVILITLTFSIKAIDENAETSVSQYKELVRDNVERELQDFGRLLRNPIMIELFTKGTDGDNQAYDIAVYNMLRITLGEPYYVALARDGEVILSKVQGEAGKPLPEDVIVEGSLLTKSFREKAGQLVIASASLNEYLSAVAVVDITDEVEEARIPFEEQKTQVKWTALILLVCFLIVSILVAVFVIGWANSRYISKPIRELEDMANRMMEGDISQDIEVNEESDYYALQALLDSMQKLLREMESKG